MPDFEPSPRSPEFVRLSTAAAITLGLSPGRMYRVDCTHCLNLLLTYPEGCRANCAYCGLAREAAGEAGARAFIRVEWPLARFCIMRWATSASCRGSPKASPYRKHRFFGAMAVCGTFKGLP